MFQYYVAKKECISSNFNANCEMHCLQTSTFLDFLTRARFLVPPEVLIANRWQFYYAQVSRKWHLVLSFKQFQRKPKEYMVGMQSQRTTDRQIVAKYRPEAVWCCVCVWGSRLLSARCISLDSVVHVVPSGCSRREKFPRDHFTIEGCEHERRVENLK